MIYAVAPSVESPYEDIRIVNEWNQTVCRLPLDDAPVRDYNEAQRQRAYIIARALTEAEKDS